ncbi:Uncharacterised protein [Mycobacteroides abscessus]|nr:Uncharacterised protein [Mycobacteroides abscessus]
MHGIFNGHLQDIGNILALVVHFQRFTIIAFAMTGITWHIHIRQEVHRYLDHAVTFTGFTAATFHVKRETTGSITACLGFLRL